MICTVPYRSTAGRVVPTSSEVNAAVSASARQTAASLSTTPGTTWITFGHPATACPPTVHHTTYAPARFRVATNVPRLAFEPLFLVHASSESSISSRTEVSVNVTSCGPDAATESVCHRFHAVALPKRSRACMRTTSGSPATAAVTPGPCTLVPSSFATHDEDAACPGSTTASNGDPCTGCDAPCPLKTRNAYRPATRASKRTSHAPSPASTVSISAGPTPETSTRKGSRSGPAGTTLPKRSNRVIRATPREPAVSRLSSDVSTRHFPGSAGPAAHVPSSARRDDCDASTSRNGPETSTAYEHAYVPSPWSSTAPRLGSEPGTCT